MLGMDEELKPESFPRRVEHHVFRRVFSGFLVLAPVLVTFLILRLFFKYVDGFFEPLVSDTIFEFPGFGVIVTLALLYVIGSFFAGRRLQAAQDAILTRIPVVRNIYGVARQATDALTAPGGHQFSKVVFVEWPRPGVRALGFVTGHVHLSGNDTNTMIVVYIPTVPNPTSGNLAWIPEQNVIETTMTVEQAMKVVFSGGVVLPKSSDVYTVR